MDSLDDLLLEGFHTYQIYLQCTMILEDPKAKLPLLKWPDVAQSALGYARAWENKNPLETRITPEIKTAMMILQGDLIVAAVAPIEVIYKSTYERVKQVLGKEPTVTSLSLEGRSKFPISYKNHVIESINDMFGTLKTMTGIGYPELKKRETNGSTS